MTADEATPSITALWSRATAGIPRDALPECPEQPEAHEASTPPKDKATPDKKSEFRAHQQAVNAETDAKLIEAMQARIMREASQRRQVRAMQIQAAARVQQQAPPIPQPDPAVVRQAIAAAQHQHQPRPRPQWRGLEKTASMLTPGYCKSWRACTKQKRKTKS